MNVLICKDFPKLKESKLLRKWVEDGETHMTAARSKIDGTGGQRVCHNGNQTMIVLSGIDGLTIPDYIVVTSYEEIFGYRRQVEDENGPVFGEPIVDVVPAHFRQVIVGYEDDLTKPIYEVERIVTPTTRTVTQEDGTEITVAGRPIIEYVTTSNVTGYESKPIYGTEQVEEQTYTYPNPIMETIPAIPEMRKLYDSVYPRTPVKTEDGEYTPSKLFGIPAGSDVSHIL